MDPKSCLPWMRPAKRLPPKTGVSLFHPSFFMFRIRDPPGTMLKPRGKSGKSLVLFQGPTQTHVRFFWEVTTRIFQIFWSMSRFFFFRLCSFICVLGDFPKLFPKIPKVRKLGCLVIPGTFSCLECTGNGTSTLPKSWKVQRTQELECWKDLPGGTKEVVVSLRFEGWKNLVKTQHF